MKIYMFLVYWISIHMQHASMCLSIMFLYLNEFWKIKFPIEKSKFGKIQVLVFGNISLTQKWFKMFEICVEIFNTSLYFNVK